MQRGTAISIGILQNALTEVEETPSLPSWTTPTLVIRT